MNPSNLVLAYLSAGILLLAVQLIRQKLGPERRQYDWHIDEKGILGFIGRYVIPVLLAAVVIAAWPAFLPLMLKRRKPVSRDPAELEFKVKPRDLQAVTSVAEIEASEIVKDPLGAVPEIPFGHLNETWLAFKDKLRPADSINRFSTNWVDPWGYSQHLEGYVIVNNSHPGSFLVTQCIGLGKKCS